MKKILIFICSLTLLFSFTACGGSGGDQNTGGGDPDNTEMLSAENISGEITVSCYDTTFYKAFLEESAQLFEAKYPGTKVNIETFSAMPDIKTGQEGEENIQIIEAQDNPQGRADYISKLNNAFMSGKGPDLIAMDVMPVHQLVARGQLLDLTDYMKNDPEFNPTDYRTNILQAVKSQGGSYFLPLDYMFDYYTYDRTLFDGAKAGLGLDGSYSTQKLADLGIPSFNGSAKLFNEPSNVQGGGSVFQRLLNEDYRTFVDLNKKKANFADGKFAQLLEQTQEYEAQGYVPPGVNSQMDAAAMMEQMGNAPTDRYFFKAKNCFSLSQHFNEDMGQRLAIQVGNGLPGVEDDDEIAGILANQDGQIPFTFSQAYGVNANSKNAQTAWAFLRFMLSEDQQLSATLMPMGLPLHNEARTQKAEFLVSGAFFGLSGEMDDNQQKILEKYQAAMEKLSGRINSYPMQDTIIDDMIAAESQHFFNGEKTAAEVATVLQNRVSLYLNE